MQKRILTIIICIMLIIMALPVTALAYDYGGYTYNNNDYNKLRAFLETESAEAGVKNGEKINPGGYDPDDPATWTGVDWNQDGDTYKGVMYIGYHDEWTDMSLAGSLDLSGFDFLERVYVGQNQISSINVSGDSNLVYLHCYANQLTALDCAGLAALDQLNCSVNNISALDVSTNTALTALWCAVNNLTALDVSANTELSSLDYSNNDLPSVDISHNTNINLLGCISTGTSSLDISSLNLLALFCDGNELTSLDLAASTWLNFLTFTDNRMPAINATICGNDVSLTARGDGYVELYRYFTGEYYANAVACTGKTFFNWTDESGTIVSTNPKYNLSADTEYNLNANFSCTVTFDKNGGDTDSDPATVAASSKLTATAIEPTRTGYVFGGWYKEAACTNAWDFDNDTVTTDITLYAKWTELKLASSVSSGKIYTGGRITLTPSVEGGEWDWDDEFFSATFNSPATFTAMKAGKSTITYTVSGVSTTYDVTIEQSDLPQTGQDFSIVWFLAVAALLSFSVSLKVAISKKEEKLKM